MRLIGLMRLIRLIIYALTAQSYTKVFISERKINHIKKKRAFFFAVPTFFRKFAGENYSRAQSRLLPKRITIMNATISLDNLLLTLSSLSTSNKRWLADRLYEQTRAEEENIEVVSSEILTHSVSVAEARKQVLDMVHAHFQPTAAV